VRSVPRTALVQRLEGEVSELQRRLAEAQVDLAEASGETLAAYHSSDPVILDSFLREDLGEMPWLVPGLLAEGSVAIVVAHGGVGKTTLITQLALSLAAGVHVAALDARIIEPCPVLYVAAEGARIAFRARVETARRNLNIPTGGTRWFIQPRDLSDYLIGSRGLERLIVKSGCRLAILDTLGYFWKGDRNSDTDWKERVMQPLRALIGRTGAAFLLVHHLGKGDDWKGRGTSAMFDDSDLFLQMEPGENATPGNADQPVRLWVRKNKYAPSNYYFDLVYRTEAAIFEKGA